MPEYKKHHRNNSEKVMSKLLEVVFVNTEPCIPVFYKDHTEANTTVNLKNQLHVWFTSQGLPPVLLSLTKGPVL